MRGLLSPLPSRCTALKSSTSVKVGDGNSEEGDVVPGVNEHFLLIEWASFLNDVTGSLDV